MLARLTQLMLHDPQLCHQQVSDEKHQDLSVWGVTVQIVRCGRSFNLKRFKNELTLSTDSEETAVLTSLFSISTCRFSSMIMMMMIFIEQFSKSTLQSASQRQQNKHESKNQKHLDRKSVV